MAADPDPSLPSKADAVPEAARPQRRSMVFRKRRTTAPPTPGQARRQSEIVQSAWRHFGESAPAIAFLNTRHEALGAQPLHLAIESDEGFERVATLLQQMTRKA
jgi:uncharacterized protein (DUF2384 family)